MFILFSVLGIITLFISIIGAYIATKQALYLGKPGGDLSSKLSHVFWTDAGIYAMTAMFGIVGFISPIQDCDISQEWVLAFTLRIPVLLINIFASWNLYQHYKMVR